MLAAAFAAMTLGIAGPASAHEDPAGCTTNGMGGSIARTPTGTVKHGDEICYRATFTNLNDTDCHITGFNGSVVLPNGTSVPVLVNVDLPQGTSITCPGNPLCATASNCTIAGQVGYRYIVAHADEVLSFSNCGPTVNFSTPVVRGIATGSGVSHTENDGTASVCQAGPNTVAHACCEPCTGTCTQVLSAGNCPFPSVFTADKNCDEVTCTPRNCNDQTVCTDDSCNPATGECVNTPRPPCTDNTVCTTDRCDPILGCVFTPNPPCTDNTVCTTDRCDPVEGCVFTPNPPCNDNTVCTTDRCDPILGCVFTPIPPCDDNTVCTDDRCDPILGCVFTPRPPCTDNTVCTDDRCDPILGCVFDRRPPCDDNTVCTDDRCDPILGCVFTPRPPCTDNNVCTDDRCDSILGCVFTPRPPCDDNNVCTDDRCDSVAGCVFVDNGSCREAICRTPGFWGTHARANPAKKNSKNITQAVINAGGGALFVCGECINATVPVNNAASSVEATCVSPRGAIVLQNARQLTALALNCIVSGFGDDCSGDASLTALFSDCNNACVGAASTRTNTQCRNEIDCFNNGGQYNAGTGFCQTGTCANGAACNGDRACADLSRCTPLPDNCHDRRLVNEDLGLDFDPPGPAGSSDDCNAAIGNHCAILPLTCSATTGSGEACCGSDSCP